jgi:beta-lactamase regulating signal transducer with metallopeptidase domain
MSIEIAVILKTAAIVCCACLVTLAMRRASASARHAIWALALGAVLAVPLISALLPDLELPVSQGGQAETAAAPVLARGEVSKSTVATEGAPVPVSPQANRDETAVAARPWGWRIWLWSAWGLGALVVTLRWVAAWWELRNLKRRSAALLDGAWPQVLSGLKRELKITAHVEVRIGSDSVGPMTWGIFHRVVLLPASAADWTLDRQRAVLAHALAHVKRRDGLVRMLAQTARIAYWFNPLVWYAAYRLELERERACDDCVLRLGTDAADYADHLVAIERGLNSAQAPASASMCNAAQLKSRLPAILEPRTRRRELSFAAFVTLSYVAAIVTVPLAVVQFTTLAAMSQKDRGRSQGCSEGIGRGITTMAADAAGNLFFADRQRNQVFKLAQDGNPTVVAGSGQRGFSGDGGPATAAQLGRIGSIAASPAGDLFISRIRTASDTQSNPCGNHHHNCGQRTVRSERRRWPCNRGVDVHSERSGAGCFRNVVYLLRLFRHRQPPW